MADLLIALALVGAICLAVRAARRCLRRGGACCGEREAAPTRTRVANRDRSRYPYETEFAIYGMTCESCAMREENALNALPGTWASVSLGTRRTRVRTEGWPDLDALRAAVAAAGYAVL